jgi:hypothetical protein
VHNRRFEIQSNQHKAKLAKCLTELEDNDKDLKLGKAKKKVEYRKLTEETPYGMNKDTNLGSLKFFSDETGQQQQVIVVNPHGISVVLCDL